MASLKKIFLIENYLAVYLIIIFLFDLVLLSFPLTGIFGYEYSAFNSLILVLLSGIFTANLFRKLQLDVSSKKQIVNKLIRIYSAFLFVPFLIGIVNSIFGLSCSFTDGILFFIVITIPSVIIGGALGISSFSISRKYAFLIFSILFFTISLIPVIEIYFFPQVYFYNPFIGFFPGTVYDEGLSVNLKLIIYRIINLIFYGSLFLWLLKYHLKETKLSRASIFFYTSAAAILFFILSPQFGYSTSPGSLKSELSGHIETDHFNIYYSESVEEKLIKVAALHHELYYKQLSEFFKYQPKEKITSFIFSSSIQKGLLFGAANADVAKPWLSQIYTTIYNYNTTLKHEIAHVFTSEFGSGLFKVAEGFNPSLIEGIASAADPVFDENKIEYLAAVAYDNSYRVKLQNLFGYVTFFTGASTLSYIYSGAFVKYLVENYGIEKFKMLYGDLNFEKIYKKSLAQLEKDFYEYLQTISVFGEEHTAHYYFGRKSIFQKVCPRYISDRIEEASNYFNENKISESAEIFKELFDLSGSYSPLMGWVNSLVKSDSIPMADSILTASINNFENTAYYYNLELKLADLSVLQNNYVRAESLYNKIIFQNPNRNLFNIAHLRKDLLSKTDMLKIYLEGNELNKYLILRELNRSSYNYYSLPVLAHLSATLKENYALFLRQFTHTIIINDYSSSYGVYKLSNYILENLDFERAKKMAALSYRYNNDKNFRYILEANFYKANWFRNNADQILNKMVVSE